MFITIYIDLIILDADFDEDSDSDLRLEIGAHLDLVFEGYQPFGRMWCFSHCENAQKSSSGTLLLSVDGPPAALEAIRVSYGSHSSHESPWLRVALPSGARRGSPSKMNVLSAFWPIYS